MFLIKYVPGESHFIVLYDPKVGYLNNNICPGDGNLHGQTKLQMPRSGGVYVEVSISSLHKILHVCSQVIKHTRTIYCLQWSNSLTFTDTHYLGKTSLHTESIDFPPLARSFTGTRKTEGTRRTYQSPRFS